MALLLIAAGGLAPAQGAQRPSPRALIAAGKAATVSQVDYARRDCHDTRTMAQWLDQVVRSSARSIVWSGGACRLRDDRNPIDSGKGPCAQATITPRRGGDAATIEVYFEPARHGAPGDPFAFRAQVHTRDGWDYMRETAAFEVNWRETYAPETPAPASDCP